MTKETGGQAFPNEGFNGWGKPEEGMTLRDYFAAKALANRYTQDETKPDKVAEWAYVIADAMLEARKQ
jgi:hypothetical protein